MIKSAVFPFHFWQPDFHTAAPTAVSAMLSSVVVKLGVYGFLRMTTLLFVAQAGPLRALLLVLGVVGVVFGGLSAIGTHNVKRMLAYSTLAQVGFILVAIGWGTPLALAAAVVFSFNHSLIKAAMLMLAGDVASHASVKSASFAIVTGVGRALPLAGVLFFVGSLALAGIPPTNGFVSKMMLFSSGLGAARLLGAAADRRGQPLHADLHDARLPAHLVAGAGRRDHGQAERRFAVGAGAADGPDRAAGPVGRAAGATWPRRRAPGWAIRRCISRRCWEADLM